jgi:lysophospholipase L1-like esterase
MVATDASPLDGGIRGAGLPSSAMRRHRITLLAAAVILGLLGITVLIMGTAADDGPAVPPTATEADASPSPPDLPDVMGAIGDSLTAAVDAGEAFGPAPQHSWAVGDDPDDGVDSHRERLVALGATDLRVVDVSRSGARIEDGVRQATALVTAVDALEPAGSVYVTLVLGANDLCGPLTPPDAFEEDLRRTVGILRDGVDVDDRQVPGLPAGSRLLMLSVPNVLTLREVFADDAEAQRFYARFRVCERALHPDATSSELERVAEHLEAYNAIIAATCDELDAAVDVPGLSCRHDLDGDPTRSLTGAAFGREEISRIDFFHPSIAGQARIAEETWGLGYWGDSR